MGANEFRLISVGIDIGTTTTQLIISGLVIKNRLPGARIPKIEIVKKEILYKSDIYITPVIDHRFVDAPAIRDIISREYQKAGFDIRQIDTGAIIVTGETAKKENAEKIVHELADFAGDFVVAVAGPELESILAGKGSGAADLSAQTGQAIINLDIGGGTTNIAVFESGRVTQAICVNVGGRLVEVDPATQTVTYIAKPAQCFIDCYGLAINVGGTADKSAISALCAKMVQFVDCVVLREEVPDALSEILMTAPLKRHSHYDAVMFSGGVAEYIYSKKSEGSDGYPYGDIGPVLAQAFRDSKLAKNNKLLTPRQAIRATVVGAGTQTVNLSGSTVFIDPSMLPLRNIPVAKIDWSTFPAMAQTISDILADTIRRYQGAWNQKPIALSIPCPRELSFENIRRMASGIYDAWQREMNPDTPLVILLERDIGKVLGQTLYSISSGRMKFLSIDSVSLRDGDYIDIGKPISTDDVVPVIIKTLVFS